MNYELCFRLIIKYLNFVKFDFHYYFICFIFIFLLLLLFPIITSGQAHYLPVNIESNFRYEKNIYSQANFHTSIKPYLKSEVNNCDSIDSLFYLKEDKRKFNYLLNNNLVETNYFSKRLQVSVNPIFTAIGISDLIQKENNFSSKIGISIQGYWKDKFDFQFNYFAGSTQQTDLFLQHIDSFDIIPHYQTFFKKSANNYFYSSPTGYISYSPSKVFHFQTGIGKNFFGDGYRSLLLSDNVAAYPYFKTTVSFWNFRYTYLVAGLRDANYFTTNKTLQRKYMATHYVSWNINSRISLQLFESVMWYSRDSLGYRGVDVNYLNPIIFFRPVEFSLGSPDNVLLGFNTKINITKNIYFYAQTMFDELIISELKSGNGWWGNKFGYQTGIKYFDCFGINNLQFRAEYNEVRPFTYSHTNNTLNYGNYFQPLAHPNGANFKEFINIITYSKNRFSFELKNEFLSIGLDTNNLSVGQNIYFPYILRNTDKDYGNYTSQGMKTKVLSNQLKFSYLINPKINLLFEFSAHFQYIKSEIQNKKNLFFEIGFVNYFE